MATKIAVGCSECNGDIRDAEIRMALAEGYCSGDMYMRIPLPRPMVLLDGEDMTGREVVAISLSLGLVTMNDLRRMPDGAYLSHLCECESGYVAVQLWQGAVALRERPLAVWEAMKVGG